MRRLRVGGGFDRTSAACLHRTGQQPAARCVGHAGDGAVRIRHLSEPAVGVVAVEGGDLTGGVSARGHVLLETE